MARSAERIRAHYEIEKELAERLRRVDWETRAKLYGEVYNELFRRVPDHPQLARKTDRLEEATAVKERMALLSRFLQSSTVFLEIGAGGCELAREVAMRVKKCYALDVSDEILERRGPATMEVVMSDGRSVPVPDQSVTLAYSYQVMEHIHPEDAMEQGRNIYRSLADGGRYLCVTPNRVNGPHDVSRYFDSVAKGLHLKEYTVRELDRLFRTIGFRKSEAYIGICRRYFRVPLMAAICCESVVALLPKQLGQALGNLRGVRNLLFISLCAIK